MTVAIWVLSPISAKKKAATVVPLIPPSAKALDRLILKLVWNQHPDCHRNERQPQIQRDDIGANEGIYPSAHRTRQAGGSPRSRQRCPEQ